MKQTHDVTDGCQTRSCHESIRFNVGDETLRDRSEQPVVIHDDSSHEQTMLNEVNMDFRIPGLPHSVVTHAQSTSVRELIQKIGGHLFIETVASRSFIENTLDLSIPKTSSRREDLTATDMENFQETNHITWPIT